MTDEHAATTLSTHANKSTYLLALWITRRLKLAHSNGGIQARSNICLRVQFARWSCFLVLFQPENGIPQNRQNRTSSTGGTFSAGGAGATTGERLTSWKVEAMPGKLGVALRGKVDVELAWAR